MATSSALWAVLMSLLFGDPQAVPQSQQEMNVLEAQLQFCVETSETQQELNSCVAGISGPGNYGGGGYNP